MPRRNPDARRQQQRDAMARLRAQRKAEGYRYNKPTAKSIRLLERAISAWRN